MEVRAVTKYVKVQPRKVRIIADEVRGMNAAFAANKLRHHTSKSALLLRKTLVSAMANATENNGLEANSLKIAAIWVDSGPVQKRMRARAQGRGAPILKKTSHITVVVEDVEATPAVKPHGTRPKARPTLAPRPARGAGRTAARPTASPARTPQVEPKSEVGASEAASIEEARAAAEATAGPVEVIEGGGEAAGADTPQEATPAEASDAPEEEGSAKTEEND